MKPIVIAVEGVGSMSSEEVCASILDLDRWREFEGHGLLPGIERAVFEVRTPEVVGTRIRVFSKDGSEHVEEIVEWDTQRRIASGQSLLIWMNSSPRHFGPVRLRSGQAPGYPARAGACTELVEVAEEFGNPGIFIAISVHAGKMPAAG